MSARLLRVAVLIILINPLYSFSQSMTIPIVEEGNPFLESFFVSEHVGTTHISEKYGTNIHDLRHTAESYCHPQSPHFGKVEYKERFFFLMDHVLSDTVEFIGLATARRVAYSYGLLKENLPNELSAERKSRYDRILRNSVKERFDFTAKEWAPIRVRWSWYNAQVRWAIEYYTIGVALGNDTIQYMGESYFDYAFQDSVIQDDGGINYVGFQNEVFTYRVFNVESFAWYYLISQNQAVLPLFKKMAPYYPISTYEGPNGQLMGEYYTAVSWKHYWNMSGPGVPYMQAALANDPYNMDFAQKDQSRDNVYFYRPDLVEAVDQPESNYTLYDGNILGPRARYGDFGYAASSRVVDDFSNYPKGLIGVGKSSLVGAHVIKKSGGGLIYDAAIDIVGLEVKYSPGENTEDRRRKYRFMTTNEKSSTTNSKQLYGLTSTYQASHKLNSDARPYVPLDWLLHEQWIFTPERLIGHLTVNSLKDDHKAFAIGSIVKMVSGRAWWGTKKEIVDHGEGHYSFGRLHFIIREQNLGGETITEYAPMYGESATNMSEKSTYHRILDYNNQPGVEEQKFSYNISDKFYYVIEIFEEGTGPSLAITSEREEEYHLLEVNDGKRNIKSIMNISADTLSIRDSTKSAYALAAALRSWHPDQPLLKERMAYTYDIPAYNSILLIQSDDSLDVDVLENHYPDIFPASNYCNVGSPCDDGNPCTHNDVYTSDCSCEGTIDISLDADNDGICDYGDLTEGDCTFKSVCDDGDPCTINDTYDAFCNCRGIPQDADEDGICVGLDCDDNDPEVGQLQEAGTACDDGDPTTFHDTYQEDGCTCRGIPQKELSLRLFLEGPYDASMGLMHDSLRHKKLLPLEDPYGLGATVNPSLLEEKGADAVIDWVQVEVRDKEDPSMVLTSAAMLLQRDGDLITAGGDSLLTLSVDQDSAYLTVSHANHLSLSTGIPVRLADTLKLDFSRLGTAIFGGQDSGKMIGDIRFLIAGDANGDGTIDEVDKAQHWRLENGTSTIYGRSQSDFNLDGVINIVDRNEYWQVNVGKVSLRP